MSEESKTENSSKLKKFLQEKEAKRSQFIAAIICNLILLYIVNNVLSWNLSFITSSFNEVIWIFNIFIIANILANIAFLLYYSPWFRGIIQIILNIIGFIVVYSLYVVFPFVFSNGWITFGLKFALIICMIGIVIGTLVELVRIIFIYLLKIEE